MEKPTTIRVLVHPFYRAYTGGTGNFSQFLQRFLPKNRKTHEIRIAVWKKEIDRAAEKGQYFAFVANPLGQITAQKYHELKTRMRNKNTDNAKTDEEKLLAYAIQKIKPKKLVVVPCEDVFKGYKLLNFMAKKHLEEQGLTPEKIRAVIFGELMEECVLTQANILHQAGVSKNNIAIFPHKSIPGDHPLKRHTWPSEWIALETKASENKKLQMPLSKTKRTVKKIATWVRTLRQWRHA